MMFLVGENQAAVRSGGGHNLPHQPGRQRHFPVAAWQSSAWTQSHFFKQPGPNVPICTCEQFSVDCFPQLVTVFSAP